MTHHTTNRDASEASSDGATGDGRPTATRRSVLRAAAAGATGLAVGTGAIGSGSAAGIPTPPLIRCGNELRDPTGEPVILRGVTIADPGRQLRPARGQTAEETVALALDETAMPPAGTRAAEEGVEGWHADVIRIPIQPQDVYAGTGNGKADPSAAMPHGDPWGPVLPGEAGDSPAPITEATLTEYFSEIVDPLVDRIEAAGAYAMLTYSRHYPVYHPFQFHSDEDGSHCTGRGFDDAGGCGERGVLWHGPSQREAVVNNLSPSLASLREFGDLAVFLEPHAEALGEEIEAFWRFVAGRYGDRDHVCFDLYDEPTGPYEQDWGAPGRHPRRYEGYRRNPIDNPVWWDLWIERAQPWVEVVEETAPGSVVSIGSPRGSQFTYHAGTTSEFDADAIQLCYTAQISMQASFDVVEQYAPPSDEVPLFFTDFGWATGGGRDEDPALAGDVEDAIDRLEPFVVKHPVHPIAATFDHTWEPVFFEHGADGAGEGSSWMASVMPYSERPAQWWMQYLFYHREVDTPTAGPGVAGCAPSPPDASWGPTSDPDGDGKYEDLTGNGQTDPADVVRLFEHKDDPEIADYPRFYDFSGNGDVEVADVVDLFRELAN